MLVVKNLILIDVKTDFKQASSSSPEQRDVETTVVFNIIYYIITSRNIYKNDFLEVSVIVSGK